MTPLSQVDPRWAGNKLGTCSVTIKTDGCFISSLGMLCGKNPDEVNDILRDNGGYSSGCLVNSVKAAEFLELEYNGKTTAYQNSVCIAETLDYGGQHFFVWLGNGEIIDPLIYPARITNNNYKITSYRLFKAKGEDMGYSDENMRLIIESSFRTMREVLLGKVDEKGLKADIELAVSQTKTGNVDAIAHQFEDYMIASDLKWVKKTDADKACQAKLNEMSTSMSSKCNDQLDEQIEKDKEICENLLENNVGKKCPPCPPSLEDAGLQELAGMFFRKLIGK